MTRTEARINIDWGDGPLVKARDAFLVHLRAEGRAEGTIRPRQEAVQGFIAYLGGPMPPASITTGHVEGFLAALASGGLASNTRRDRYAGLRLWFGFMVDRGIISTSPVGAIRRPKSSNTVVEPYTRAEVDAMLDAVSRPRWLRRENIPRNAVIIRVLYATGIRASELLGLTVDDVLPGQLLIRRGKGGKGRYVPLDEDTEKALLDYAEGRQGKLFPLAYTGLARVIERAGQKAGVKRPTIHRFRHSYACSFLQAGGAIDSLQILLGHSRMETTQGYVQWDREQRAIEVGRRFSPWAAGNNGNDGTDDFELPAPATRKLPNISPATQGDHIGGLIRRLRRERSISQASLSRCAGVSQGYLSQLEAGDQNNPSIKILGLLARGLQADVYDLLQAAGLGDLIVDGQKVDPVLLRRLEDMTPNQQRRLLLFLDGLDGGEG